MRMWMHCAGIRRTARRLDRVVPGLRTCSLRSLTFVTCILLSLCILCIHRAGSAPSSSSSAIAYFMQVSNSTAFHFPRLLSSLHERQSIYLVHFDLHIASHIRSQLHAVVLQSPKYSTNVHILPSRIVSYAGISMLLNTLDAIEFFLSDSNPTWSHFINLSASDYPLIPSSSLRALLTSSHFRNAIFLQPQRSSHNHTEFFTRRVRTLHLDPALWNVERNNLISLSNANIIANEKTRPLSKAEGWTILPRDFCVYSVRSSAARTLLAALSTARASDEHFFPTLAKEHIVYKHYVLHDALRYIHWGGPNSLRSRPAFLDLEDSKELRLQIEKSGAAFARKFSLNRSMLLNWIDGSLKTEEKAAAMIKRVKVRATCALSARHRMTPLQAMDYCVQRANVA